MILSPRSCAKALTVLPLLDLTPVSVRLVEMGLMKDLEKHEGF